MVSKNWGRFCSFSPWYWGVFGYIFLYRPILVTLVSSYSCDYIFWDHWWIYPTIWVFIPKARQSFKPIHTQYNYLYFQKCQLEHARELSFLKKIVNLMTPQSLH